jgi:hypothetical protein
MHRQLILKTTPFLFSTLHINPNTCEISFKQNPEA